MNQTSYQEALTNLLNSKRIPFSADDLHKALYKSGGLYRITHNSDPKKTLYIGKAKDIKQRLYNNLLMGQVRSHTLKRKLIKAKKCTAQPSAKKYLQNNCSLQYILMENPRERTFNEHYFISILRPEYND